MLANLFELKAPDLDDINSPIRELESRMLKMLIMNLKEEKGDIVFVTSEYSSQGN